MRKFTTLLALLPLLAVLTGCVSYSPSIPPGYTGPKATLKDSVQVHSNSKVDYFVATAIDGGKIKNSRIESRVSNRGQGFHMDPVFLDREIPARALTVDIVARTEYAAPILALTRAVYEVVGTIKFVPLEGRTYVVTGTLGETYSAVWVADAASKEVMDKKVEIKGSAKLGILQK